MRSVSIKKTLTALLMLVIIVYSYYISRINYLLFHSLGEMFGIIVSCSIFIIAWVTRKKSENSFFVMLGIAYLFIGIIDLFHTLSYSGMNIFDSQIYYANQLWICARMMESVSLLVFVLFFDSDVRINNDLILTVYLFVTTAVISSVFYFKNFPVCFVKGQGQTAFKIGSEYVICAMLFVSIIVIVRKRKSVNRKIYLFMVWSLIFTLLSEFSFTLYTDNFGVINVIGHFFKIFSFYFIYKSVIEINLEEPFALVLTELNRKIEEISALNEDLEILNRTKNRFFAIIAHDLKNPVNGLNGLLNLVNRDWTRFSEDEKKFYIDQLFRSSDKLVNLLNNLLLWAGNQMNKSIVNMKEISLSGLVNENIMLLQTVAASKNIEITSGLTQDYHIKADRDTADVVIRNILTNALKFTRTGGTVRINAEENGSNVILSIEDNGIGMSDAVIEKLFKIDNTSHRKGTEDEEGTGLGLILCKDFMDRNGGEIIVESEENEGSTFRLAFQRI